MRWDSRDPSPAPIGAKRPIRWDSRDPSPAPIRQRRVSPSARDKRQWDELSPRRKKLQFHHPLARPLARESSQDRRDYLPEDKNEARSNTCVRGSSVSEVPDKTQKESPRTMDSDAKVKSSPMNIRPPTSTSGTKSSEREDDSFLSTKDHPKCNREAIDSSCRRSPERRDGCAQEVQNTSTEPQPVPESGMDAATARAHNLATLLRHLPLICEPLRSVLANSPSSPYVPNGWYQCTLAPHYTEPDRTFSRWAQKYAPELYRAFLEADINLLCMGQEDYDE